MKKKEMLINVLQPEECRIAIVEDGVLEELYVERTAHESYTGNIYKGKIVNLEPAIQAAFVDFSVGRNGFLHVSDVEPQYYQRQMSDDAEFGPRDKHRDPRRLRDEPPAAGPGAPPRPVRERDDRPRDERPPRDRDRDRDRPPPRERPDRMEKGRRDRSEPRRFGEGLDDDRLSSPRPAPVAPPPPPVSAPAPAPPVPTAPPPLIEESWGQRGRERDRDRERSFGAPEPEVRGRLPEPLDPLEAELPPSRTSRHRPTGSPINPPQARFPQSPGFGAGPAGIGHGIEDEAPRARTIAPRTYEPIPPTRGYELPPEQPRAVPPIAAPAPPPEPEPIEEVVDLDAEIGRGARGESRPRRGTRGGRGRRVPSAEPLSAPPVPALEPAPVRDFDDLPVVPEVREDVEFEPEPEAAEPEPTVGDAYEPPARRGRAAIRSRGGERTREPIAPRERERERPRDREVPPARPLPPAPVAPTVRETRPSFEPPAAREVRPSFEPPAPVVPVPPPIVAPEIEKEPRETTRERPAARSRERDRDRDTERPRTRHSRAGEPGYVPRHKRLGTEPEAEAIPAATTPAWPETVPAAEPEPFAEDLFDDDREELVEEGGEETDAEAARRRRRRRGRRRKGEGEDAPTRERTRPAPVEPTVGGFGSGLMEELDAEAAEFEEEDADDEAAEPEVLPERPRRDRDRDRGRGRERGERERERKPVEPRRDREDFDFGEEISDEDEDDLIDGDADAEAVGVVREPAVEERIDPELEEEIRREIEEIAELEREMGLRGTVEARPRRGDREGPADPAARTSGVRARGVTKPPIQEIFRRGDEVLVQVIKESIGTKGPTLSTYISIPGRYLVLMPGLNRVGVSRKIADESQRRKLREIMHELNPPKGLGFIVRTAGLDRSKRELARDLAYLLRLWKSILRRIKRSRAPAVIYQESDMITRTIRDIFTSEIDTIWIDEPRAFEHAQEFLRNVMPKYVDRLKLHEEKAPLFHKYGIEDEIAKIHRKVVPLPEGGSIVIEPTEALVAIDVNSGNFRVENDAEKTAYEMNLRAAKEIARQLRLRDLGGVIINDFIDMRDERNRRGVEKALRDAIKRDRARTKVLRMSQFGIIEMTRQRIRPSLKRSVYEDCAHCKGAGVVKTVESIAIDVMRWLALAAHREDVRRVNVTVASGVATHLNNRKRAELARLETEGNIAIFIRHEESAAPEHLQIDCFDAANGEIRLFAPPVPTTVSGRKVLPPPTPRTFD